jgi:putative endopeptidase
MSDEELLGKLGWVIGHEISHAFDSKGAQFDKDGNMKNWWTEEDYAAFRTRNDKMIAYYNGMHPWAGQDFYGSIVTGEAGADMAGMKAVLRIAGEKKDFDYDKFFRAMADIWLLKDTLQNAYKRINNVHPMGYLRINCTLQQYDEFLNFYGIAEGDGMYLAPEDRVAIW